MRKDYSRLAPAFRGKRHKSELFSSTAGCGLICAVLTLAGAGSQRWLQLAVNRNPQLLVSALQQSGAIGAQISVAWHSPLEDDGCLEYRDRKALAEAGIANLKKPLDPFWPARGPVWDALGITSEGHPLFIAVKAHIPEAATSSTRLPPLHRGI